MTAPFSRLQAILDQHGAALLAATEGRAQATGLTPEQLLTRLAAVDPSHDRSAMPWLVSCYLATGFELADLDAVGEALAWFAEYRQGLPVEQRSLSRYGSLSELQAVAGAPQQSRSRQGASGAPVPSAAEAAANFQRWFGASQVVDAAGQPLAVYHATRESFTAFEPQRGKDAGFHFGTRVQAMMRSGPRGTVLEVFLSAQRLKRVRDDGQWNKAKIAAIRRQGYDGIVYLNRYEGMTTERIEALSASGMLSRLDGLSDAQFRRLVPEAKDSFIVFEPTQIKSTSNPGTWLPSDPRIDDGGRPTEEPDVVAPGVR